METEGKKILVNYLTDIADTFRSITGETDTISAQSFSKEVQTVATSSSKNSYQRSSVEEMNAITDARDGDRCLILEESESNITEDGKVRRLSFPKQVTMTTPVTQFYIAVLETPSGGYGHINLFNSNFVFMLTEDSSEMYIGYSSTDGVTYTRDAFNVEGNFTKIDDNTVDFGFNVSILDTNEYIGAFLLGIVTTYGGIYTRHGDAWDIQGLGYEITPENVEASIKYYNDGEQEGLLGSTGTLQGVQKLNNFIKEYGVDFTYPKDMSHCFLNYEGERIPLLELNSNTGNVTNMDSLFYGCRSLKSIPAMNTQNVTNMFSMFRECNKLSSVPVLDTSNVINMDSMFSNCESLITVPSLNTSNVTDMSDMFINCYSLVEIPTLDTSKVTYMTGMFSRCSSLKQIPLLDTKNCTEMNSIFYECTSLDTVPMLDASKAINISKIFKDCSALVMLGGLKNLGMGYTTGWNANSSSVSLDLSDSPLLTHDSLMNVINNLYDIKSKGVKTQTLQLGDTNKAKLTAEEIAIATNKGWDVK